MVRSNEPLPIAIVGGGAAGVMTALALARHPSPMARRVVILEPAEQLGLGVAYGTRSPSHLLNVRASGMSAIADAPAHFLRWAQGHDPDLTGPEFLPRHRYAPYLRDALVSAQETAAPGVTIEHRQRLVVGVDQGAEAGTFDVTLDDGTDLCRAARRARDRQPPATIALVARPSGRVRRPVDARRGGGRKRRTDRAHHRLWPDRRGCRAVLARPGFRGHRAPGLHARLVACRASRRGPASPRTGYPTGRRGCAERTRPRCAPCVRCRGGKRLAPDGRQSPAGHGRAVAEPV